MSEHDGQCVIPTLQSEMETQNHMVKVTQLPVGVWSPGFQALNFHHDTSIVENSENTKKKKKGTN